MSQDRAEILALISAAQLSGARQVKACDVIGISNRTYQRWMQSNHLRDGRLDAKHVPVNKLTALERQRIIRVVNEPAYAELPPL